MSFENKRKRSLEDDVEQEPRFHQRQHFNKRARQELSQELQLAIKLCEDITKLGEKNINNLSNDINYMSFPISEEIGESDEIRNAVLKTLYAIIIEQPHKLQHISALVKISNLRNRLVGKYVFEYLHQKAQELIDTLPEQDELSCGNLNKLKLLLRFFAINRRLIANDSVAKIFEQFLQIAVDLQAEESDRVGIAELIYYNVLISIPYLLSYGEEQLQIQHLLEIASNFKIVSKDASMLEHFDNNLIQTEKPYLTKFLINLVLPSLQDGKVDVSHFRNLDLVMATLEQELKDNGSEEIQHSLPQFAIRMDVLKLVKLSGNIDSLWNNPRILLEVYLSNTNEFETRPSNESYFGLLLNDICQDIIQNMEFNKNAVAQQLLILDSFFEPKTFAKPGSSIDKLTILNDKKNGTVLEVDMDDPSSVKIAKLIEEVDLDLSEGYTSTWKIEDVITESILNLIFNLPDISNPIIYFYTVLVECCSKESKLMAPVFGRAIRFFFAFITVLDFELRSRYLDWLAVQLSNFRFQWKWHEWTDYVVKYDLLKYSPVMIFIRNLIAKEIRLSSVKKITETLPESFNKYLDISLNNSSYIENYDTDIFGTFWDQKDLELKFINEANSKHEQCSQIYEKLSGDAPSVEELTELVQNLQCDDRYLINLIFQSVCVIGCRSISHVKSFIEQKKDLLTSLVSSLSTDSNIKIKWIIESVLRIWNHDPQIGYLILEMLLTQKIIDGTGYVNSLFENGSVILNISSVESLLRVLSNLELYNIDSEIFSVTFELIQSQLKEVITKLGAPEEILIVDQDEEMNDDKWCYVELLKMLKSILRKYHKNFENFQDHVTVDHEQTRKIIIGYLDELMDLN